MSYSLNNIAKYGNTIADVIAECMDTWTSNNAIMLKAFESEEYARACCVEDYDVEIDSMGAIFALEQYLINSDNTAFYNALAETGITEEELHIELDKIRNF